MQQLASRLPLARGVRASAAAAGAARFRPPLSSLPAAAAAAAHDAAASETRGPPPLPSLSELVSQHGARLTTAAQLAMAEVLRPGDTAVDATCGNGHDALFLAQRVGPAGRVVAVDIQQAAVDATRGLLAASLPPGAAPALEVTRACHSQLQQLAGSQVASVVCFNLGYLPRGDKAVITRADTTVQAVEAALEVVKPGGLISLLAYVGHPGGAEEYAAVRALLKGLPPAFWAVSETKLVNRPSAPVLLLAWRCAAAAGGAGGRGGGGHGAAKLI